MGLWRGVPPNPAGIRKPLLQLRVGQELDRWFSPLWYEPGFSSFQYRLFTRYTCVAARLAGKRIPTPEFAPFADVDRVLEWVVACRARGEEVPLDTLVGAAVRLCSRAEELGKDISGTCFRVGSEPFTRAKQEIIWAAGCRAGSHYAISELGDYGELSQRRCGCLLSTVGLTDTLRNIRSYEKLTGERITFLGTDLLRLVEEVLPQSLGGRPTDYQLVEDGRGAFCCPDVARCGDTASRAPGAGSTPVGKIPPLHLIRQS